MESESEKKRAERKRQRELKNARKKELSEATSSSERRQIKAKYSEPKEKSNEGKSEGNTVADRMSQREAAAGLNLAGNNTMSGRTEQPMPTMSEREESSGLYLAGNDTTVGRDSFYDSDIEPSTPESPSPNHIYPEGNGSMTGVVVGGGGGGGGIPDGYSEVSVIICINGSPTSGTILFKT